MMFAPLVALLLNAAATTDSLAADSAASHRVVREFAPVTVTGGRRVDRFSVETVQTVTTQAVRQLPVDRFVEAVGLQAGVVAVGEDLHVRGGRAGELSMVTQGISLNEGMLGSPMELPLFAVRSAELLTGSLEADHAGSLAGELDVQTEAAGPRPSWLARWTSDGRYGSRYDAVHARITAPMFATGLGLAAALEARLDEQGLPSPDTPARSTVLGRSFGWRNDNHLLAWARLSPIESPQRASIELFAQRIVRRPYNPMFSYDGWVTLCPDPYGPFPCTQPMQLSDHPAGPTWYRYRASEHQTMTDDRRLALVASLASANPSLPARVSLGWTHARSLTSVGLRGDSGYITDANRPIFGPYDYAGADPFHVYFGDEPYFRLATHDRFTLRGDAMRPIARGHRLRAGAGLTYEESMLRELDDAAPEVAGIDTLRAFHAFAPGAFAYVQHRWDFGGLVWNGGLRAESFTPGPQARDPHTTWSFSPRAGFAYPVSTRDVLSISYSRIFQAPPRSLVYENRRTNYNRRPLGNPDLEPSEVIAWQAAVKHILDPTWSLQIGAFYRDVYGEPGVRMFQYAPFVYRSRYENADLAHASGLEFSLLRELPGRQRIEVAYTFMNAWGTQSNIDGFLYGVSLGNRAMPTGEHPLDWDERHALSLSAQLHTRNHWVVSWSTRVASGRPWTPYPVQPGDGTAWPPAATDQLHVNSRRLQAGENTSVSIRLTPRVLRGARVMFMVTNLFDNAYDARATLGGYPNAHINTEYDMYSAYRTATGNDGGAYWNDANGDGIREWVPVNDRRLRAPRRDVRVGLEVGL